MKARLLLTLAPLWWWVGSSLCLGNTAEFSFALSGMTGRERFVADHSQTADIASFGMRATALGRFNDFFAAGLSLGREAFDSRNYNNREGLMHSTVKNHTLYDLAVEATASIPERFIDINTSLTPYLRLSVIAAGLASLEETSTSLNSVKTNANGPAYGYTASIGVATQLSTTMGLFGEFSHYDRRVKFDYDDNQGSYKYDYVSNGFAIGAFATI